MRKKEEQEDEKKNEVIYRLPRIILGVLLILIGVLCFTNAEPFSRFLKWVSVFIFGVLFFVMGLAFMAVGIFFIAIPYKSKKEEKVKIPWLDITMGLLTFFSISVLLSSNDSFSNLTIENFSSTYDRLMSECAPSGYFVELPSRVSHVGGGYIPTLFVAFGNSMGMGLIGTRVLFGIILAVSLIVLLRHPFMALSKSIVAVRKEQARSNIVPPSIERESNEIEEEDEPIDATIDWKKDEEGEDEQEEKKEYEYASEPDVTVYKFGTSEETHRNFFKGVRLEEDEDEYEDSYEEPKPIIKSMDEEEAQEQETFDEKPKDVYVEPRHYEAVKETPIQKIAEPVKEDEPEFKDKEKVIVEDTSNEADVVEEVIEKPIEVEQPKYVENKPSYETKNVIVDKEDIEEYESAEDYKDEQEDEYEQPQIDDSKTAKVVYDGYQPTQTDSQIEEDRTQQQSMVGERKSTPAMQTSFTLDPYADEEDEDEDEEIEQRKEVKPVVVEPIIVTNSKKYVLPDNTLLRDYDSQEAYDRILQADYDIGYRINKFFKDSGIKAESSGFDIGASVTCFHVTLKPGVKMANIENALPNLSVELDGNNSVRFLPVITGKRFSGIEVGNPVSMTVPFKTIYDELMNKDPKCEQKLLIPLGKDVFGRIHAVQLNKLPHLLVAGSTGSGKSVFIHSIIFSILMRTYPNEVKFMLVDPKKVEFARYNDMPHLFCPIITETDQAEVALNKMVDEMERRYKLFMDAHCVNFETYAEYCKSHPNAEKIPYIVVIIDEFADLMSSSSDGSAEKNVGRLGAKARASGIHMIIATQRPSTAVISGDIKTNIPARVGLMVSSSVDSRVILDEIGAEKLMGRGDLLAKIPGEKESLRCQSSYISDGEMNDVLEYLKKRAIPMYNSDFLSLNSQPPADDLLGDVNSNKSLYERLKNDPGYIQAKKIVKDSHKANSSYLCRVQQISFNKACNYLDAMEYEGIVVKVANGKRVLASDWLGDDDTTEQNI